MTGYGKFSKGALVMTRLCWFLAGAVLSYVADGYLKGLFGVDGKEDEKEDIIDVNADTAHKE